MDDRKAATAVLPIERFVPGRVVMPLSQHLGAPARATVKRKAVVTRGDCIGETGPDGAPIHASVSGTVKRVALLPHPTAVEGEAVEIEVDPSIQEPQWEERYGWQHLPRALIVERVQAAGIVGLGGAAFPTHRKLRIPPEITIDTVIINGAECEPYLTSDHRVMLETPAEVLWGAVIMAQAVGAWQVVIGLETNKDDAAQRLREAAQQCQCHWPVHIALCETRYPQGSEKQLIEALVGRAVPPGKLPMHVGVVVQNVATAVACYHAVRYERPLLDRVITVTGGGIVTPKNLSVPIGTLVDDIVAACGGMHKRTAKVIAGGPMMGRALGRLDLPVIKGTGGLLFLRTDEVRPDCYGPCISCGKCLDVCPLGLEPNQISVYTEAGRALETESYGVQSCFECGCCSYVCPAQRPLVQFIQIAKSAFQRGTALGIAVRPGAGCHD